MTLQKELAAHNERYATLGRNERRVVRLYETGVIETADEAIYHPSLTAAERAKVAEFLGGDESEVAAAFRGK